MIVTSNFLQLHLVVVAKAGTCVKEFILHLELPLTRNACLFGSHAFQCDRLSIPTDSSMPPDSSQNASLFCRPLVITRNGLRQELWHYRTPDLGKPIHWIEPPFCGNMKYDYTMTVSQCWFLAVTRFGASSCMLSFQWLKMHWYDICPIQYQLFHTFRRCHHTVEARQKIPRLLQDLDAHHAQLIDTDSGSCTVTQVRRQIIGRRIQLPKKTCGPGRSSS